MLTLPLAFLQYAALGSPSPSPSLILFPRRRRLLPQPVATSCSHPAVPGPFEAMSQRAKSSSVSGAFRRKERGVSSVLAQSVAYPMGKQTRLPLIPCPDCKLARVIELRVKQDTPNKGRSFFKCPRNGNLKLCGFYRFQKEYFDELVDKKMIRVSCEQIEELEEGAEGIELETVKEEGMKNLEKLEKMMWKMNVFIVFVAIVVFAILVKSVVMA